jgi:hypothetical protein
LECFAYPCYSFYGVFPVGYLLAQKLYQKNPITLIPMVIARQSLFEYEDFCKTGDCSPALHQTQCGASVGLSLDTQSVLLDQQPSQRHY